MFGFLAGFLFNFEGWIANPLFFLFGLFAIWMLVDAIRRQEWFWVVFILLFPLLNAPLYFFLVYRASAPLATAGFELPGSHDRRRIRELEAQIHHLDKAHHHLELGDIYFQQGKLERALECYQRAYERDSEDSDIQSHYGQCLLRLNRPQEARPLLERVCSTEPDHEYGHTLMALAETYKMLNENQAAADTLRNVLQRHSYARARVQLAEILLETGEAESARAELREVITDDANAPDFQRKRDRFWVRKAKRMLRG